MYNAKLTKTDQWRIQDFPERQLLDLDLLLCNFFAEKCMKMEDFQTWGSWHPHLDPPMRIKDLPLGSPESCRSRSSKDSPPFNVKR